MNMVRQLLQKTWIAWLLIAGLTVLIYANTVSYEMLHNFDDDVYLKDSRISELNSSNVKSYFSDYYLGMYQPLPVMSMAFLNSIAPDEIKIQRWANILLHCFNTLLVLLLIKKITGNSLVGVFTALLFAVHPMHVESVTWFATRSNLMFAFFYLTALFVYARWQDNRKALLLICMFACFLLALFCKVTAATLPAVLLLLDWYKGRKLRKVDFLLYLSLFFLSGIFIWIGVQASTAFGHITEIGQTYSLYERVILLFHALWLYLYKFIIPVNQSAIYLYPFKENGFLPASIWDSAILGFLSVIVFLIAGWKMLKNKKEKALLFGIFFFLVTISILLPLKWSRTVIIAERYTYLPYIGLTTGLLLVLFNFTKEKGTILRYIFISLLLVYCLMFSFRSFQRNKVWENSITLFTDVVEKDGGKAEKSMGYYNRGNEYFRLQDATHAIDDYSKAIEIYPEYKEAYYNRGLVYFNVDENDAAIADFSRAIELKSSFIETYINRSSAYRKAGRFESAMEDLNKAIELHPSALAYLGRGVLFFTNLDNPVQACSDWNMAAQMGSEQAKQLLLQYCK